MNWICSTNGSSSARVNQIRVFDGLSGFDVGFRLLMWLCLGVLFPLVVSWWWFRMEGFFFVFCFSVSGVAAPCQLDRSLV